MDLFDDCSADGQSLNTSRGATASSSSRLEGVEEAAEGSTMVKSIHRPHSNHHHHQHHKSSPVVNSARTNGAASHFPTSVSGLVSQSSGDTASPSSHSLLSEQTDEMVERVVSSSTSAAAAPPLARLGTPGSSSSSPGVAAAAGGLRERGVAGHKASPHPQRDTQSLHRDSGGSTGSGGGVAAAHHRQQSQPASSSAPPAAPTLARVVQTQQEMQAALQELVARVAQVQKAVLAHQEGQGSLPGSGRGQGEGSRLQRGSGGDAGAAMFGSTPPRAAMTESVGLSREWVLISVVLVFQTFLQWYFSR